MFAFFCFQSDQLVVMDLQTNLFREQIVQDCCMFEEHNWLFKIHFTMQAKWHHLKVKNAFIVLDLLKVAVQKNNKPAPSKNTYNERGKCDVGQVSLCYFNV